MSLAREACDICGVALPADHPHLLEPSNGRILCACQPCAILFQHRQPGAKFLRIPRDIRQLKDFQISDAGWNELLLPIDLAFFVHNTAAAKVIAYYPSPAGSTESLLNLDAWAGMVESNPVLKTMQPEVEALLVNRTREHRDYFIAPIDECYKLTGIIRSSWRGLSGGDKVWEKIDHFFEGLRERSCQSQETANA